MERDTPSRRRFLTRIPVVTATVGLAGCLTGGSDRDATEVSAATTTAGGDATDESDTTSASSSGTPSPGDTPTSTPEGPRSVSFEAAQGTTIEATEYGSGDCGVVLVPQINLDRESWRPQAEMLAGMGHRALAIDEDPDDRSGSVRGAIQYLRDRGVATLVLVGASTGGEAVVVANATTDATVDGTITLSAAGGADHAADLQGRSLFVVSKGDEDRFVRVARQLHRGAPEPTALVEYEGSAHGQGFFDSEHAADLRDRLRAVVSAVCGN